ncbi:MAG: hypothetical protein EOM21_20510, partial [Gammaproteobacteria bacterium]|nr:hypothetical protein [Gammaproteobacteria bacterium]
MNSSAFYEIQLVQNEIILFSQINPYNLNLGESLENSFSIPKSINTGEYKLNLIINDSMNNIVIQKELNLRINGIQFKILELKQDPQNKSQTILNVSNDGLIEIDLICN